MVMIKALVPALLLVMSGAAWAQAELFLCDDGHGSKEYKNSGNTNGCKRIDLPGITTIPGMPRPRWPVKFLHFWSPQIPPPG